MTPVRKTSYTYWLSVTVVLVAATLVGGLYGPKMFGSTNDDALHQRLKEYSELVEAAQEWSAEEVGADDLVFSSIDGMLRTLDPHSTFLEPTDYSDMQQRQKGSFYGLGIIVTKRNDRVTVITPVEGTPAARQGIRAGDIISEIEGEETEPMSLEEVVSKLKGRKGTTVNITIIRHGLDEPIPMSIVRDAIPTNSLTTVLMLRNNVGYIRIKDFTYTTDRELDEALAKLKGEGMERLILDLRQNPGGLLDAAVDVSDHFIDKGEMIVYTKGRTDSSADEYRAPGKAEKIDVPLIVLINRGSASASEIVAGAIQDHDRGLVVGQTSWGKGLVQSVYSLQYGAGLALTTSKYYTPSGRNIQRDYSSFYDYYMADADPDSISTDGAREFSTDTGRTVYASGGISPDVFVEPRELSRTVQILLARGVIFNFAVEYYSEHEDLTHEIEVTTEIMERFAQFVVKDGAVAESALRDALADPPERDYIARSLRADIVSAKYGYEAAYPIRLEGDEQVNKALELFPDAQNLAQLSASVRGGSDGSIRVDDSRLKTSRRP